MRSESHCRVHKPFSVLHLWCKATPESNFVPSTLELVQLWNENNVLLVCIHPQVEIAFTDVLAVALGITAASIDVASGHTNFSLNNLLACCIATDLLQLIGLRSFRVAAVLLSGAEGGF